MQVIGNVIKQLFDRLIFRLSDWLFIRLMIEPYSLMFCLLALHPAIKTNDWSIIQPLQHSKIQMADRTDVMAVGHVANQSAFQRDYQPYV